jgi:hypothetical protein
MPFLGFDPPDMQTLVFALAADVRLVELDGSLEYSHGVSGHADAKMVQHVQDTASRNARFTDDSVHRPLADKDCDAISPLIVR